MSRWVDSDTQIDGGKLAYCSACGSPQFAWEFGHDDLGKDTRYVYPKYCSECGAEMSGTDDPDATIYAAPQSLVSGIKLFDDNTLYIDINKSISVDRIILNYNNGRSFKIFYSEETDGYKS